MRPPQLRPEAALSGDRVEMAARPPPWRGLLVVTAVVGLLHAALLGWVPLGLGSGSKGGVAAVLSVRQILLRAPVPVLPADPPAAAPTPRVALPVSRPRAAAEPSLPAAPGVSASEPVASPAPPDARVPEPVQPTTTADEPDAARAVADAASAAPSEPAPNPIADAGGQAVPTYATRRPPAAVLHFELRRAGLTGSGELRWQPAEDRYLAQMTGTAFALPIITWVSEGGFDAHGLAPERFVDRRRARDQRAANFQRDKGRITYSGPPVEHPLAAGAQDRLSWMLQLPAVLAADPAGFAPGARVSMQVAGARGEADVWTFGIEAVEALDVPEGRIDGAWRLLREPRRPYDTRVEVWLDPARHFLPVKVRLLQPQAGDGFEFSLQKMVLAP